MFHEKDARLVWVEVLLINLLCNTTARNVQKIKHVHKYTGFIFCTISMFFPYVLFYFMCRTYIHYWSVFVAELT